MCALDAYASLLKDVGADVLVGEGHREAIMNCVIDIMTNKTACQDQDQEVEENDEDTEAEQDEILYECAGEIIPNFGKAIKPDDFSCYFPNILALMQVRAVCFSLTFNCFYLRIRHAFYRKNKIA